MATTAPAFTIPPILQSDKTDLYELQDIKVEEVEHLEDDSHGLRNNLPQSKFATIGQAAALRLFWKGQLRCLRRVIQSEHVTDVHADQYVVAP